LFIIVQLRKTLWHYSYGMLPLYSTQYCSSVETYFLSPNRCETQITKNYQLENRLLLRSVISPFAKKYFYYRLVLIAQHKIPVLATPVPSSNLRNQAPLFTELRLLQGTFFMHILNCVV